MARTRGPTCEKCGLSRRGRRFPLQIGDQDRRLAREAERAGKPGPDLRASIPWEVAERAWAIYHAHYSNDQNVERMAERGGFSNGEMDDFLPGWRELADEWEELRRQNGELVESMAFVREFALAFMGDFQRGAPLRAPLSDFFERAKAIVKRQGEDGA